MRFDEFKLGEVDVRSDEREKVMSDAVFVQFNYDLEIFFLQMENHLYEFLFAMLAATLLFI